MARPDQVNQGRPSHDHKDEFILGTFSAHEAAEEAQYGDAAAFGFWYAPEGATEAAAPTFKLQAAQEAIELPW